MPRQARKQVANGIYHVMVRGVNKMDIFRDQEDCYRFLDILETVKENGEYGLYSYCLMKNHAHLLMKEENDSFNKSMQRIAIRYAQYFNKKYQRVGHLFQDRFKSEIIDSERYFLTCARYIHRNPVTAGLVSHPDKYPWSSYRSYLARHKHDSLLEKTTLLSLFSSDPGEAIKRLREFTEDGGGDDCFLDAEMDPKFVRRISAVETIKDILAPHNICIQDFHRLSNTQRYPLLWSIVKQVSLSGRELADILGIDRTVIYKIKRDFL